MKKLLIPIALCASAAYGSTINGTFGWVPPANSVSFAGSVLGSATSVTIPAVEMINALPPLYLGQPNDFAGLLTLGANLSVIPTNPVAHIGDGFFPDLEPAYAEFLGTRFEFDLASIEWSSSRPTNLSLLADGSLIDHLGLFDPTAVQISGSFTTTGSGAINGSFTLTTTPVATPVAEPPYVGLIGLAFAVMSRRWPRCKSL